MKNVLITGASGGIGFATAALLVRNGFRVFGSVRAEADADRLTTSLGQGFTPLVFDVTDAKAIDAAATRIRAELAGATLDGLVNNAGIAVTGPLLHVPAEDFRRQLEVNLIGPLTVTQAMAPLLGVDPSLRGAPGRIVNMSSVAGLVSVPFMGPYAASKHGLEAFSNTLRRELLVYGIRVITVGPGIVDTPFVDKTLRTAAAPPPNTRFDGPLRRYDDEAAKLRRTAVTPQRVAQAVLEALTSKRPRLRYVVVGNAFKNWILPRLLPQRLVDRYMAFQLGLHP